MIFKCLFCQDPIKDGELVCTANCEHFIHEYCIEVMKSMGEHMCKNCNEITIVNPVFKEFEKSKACTIEGMSIIIKQLDDMLKIMKSRENEIRELTNKFNGMSNRVEGLSIEHRALKFEKNEMEKRLKTIENGIKSDKNQSI